MERFHDVFDYPHELIVCGRGNHALRHKVANSLYSVVETGRERCRGAPDEVLWGERLSPSKLRHDVGEQEGEVAQVFPSQSGSQEGTELAL